MTRGARVVAALAGVLGAACGGQVTPEGDAAADGSSETAVVDTGVVDLGVDTVVPPKSPGTCKGGGAAISCAPGRTCGVSASFNVICDDGAGRPPGKHCGVVLCDISCECASAADSTCNCSVPVPGPLSPPELWAQTVLRPEIARPSVT